MSITTILVVILILILLGAIPFGSSREWGAAPLGGIGLVILILVILLLMGRI